MHGIQTNSPLNCLWRPVHLLAALAFLFAVLVLTGCSTPAPVGTRVGAMALSVGGLTAQQQVARLQAEFPLQPLPQGSSQAVAEEYLQRYQPGPLPRVFQSSYMYDRQGRLLAELFDEGRRTWVPLARISPFLRNAVIATEDGTFYENPGVDMRRVAGALLQNAAGGVPSGASTITMQLARNLFLPPEKRFSVSFDRKISEAYLAYELTRLFGKDEILEMYLNLANFGHLAYGPEAAARTYFGKSALALDLAEASLLAGLPQRPADLDPFINWEGAKDRQRIVLDLMARRGYITGEEADRAFAQPLALVADPNLREKPAPHFVQFVTRHLAQPPDNIDLLRSGHNVYTTLDLDLQDLAQQIVRERVDALRSRFNLNNGALLALKVGTAEILAMVGSADFSNNQIGGQVNVTLRPRQPGSTLKPVIYSTAFNDGLISPATLLWDLTARYTVTGTRDYIPRNYDNRFRGPVTVRMALANSLNVPTVKLFDSLNPADFIATANRMGVDSLTEEDVQRAGLALALGADEISLYELVAAYHTIANQGVYLAPTPILRVTDAGGRPLELASTPEPVQAVAPEAAYLVTDILSDNAARSPLFGPESQLRLSRPAAAKTGTTTNFRDNWTLGYTRYLVAGVWAGNNDGRPMRGASGVTGAAPIWNDFMEAVLSDPKYLSILDAPEGEAGWDFTRPEGVVQVEQSCPPMLTCRAGGEFFTQNWMSLMNTTGPYGDSFATGLLSTVNVETSTGRRFVAGLCLLQPASDGDPNASMALYLPRGFGQHAMLPRYPGEVAALSAVSAPRGVRSDIPVLYLGPPTLAFNQPVVFAPDNHLRDEQRSAMRWASSTGRSLVMGECAAAEPLARALYDDVRSVTVSEPLMPAAAATARSTPAGVEEELPPPPPSAGGFNGIVNPTGGATVAGTVPVQGVADLPNFWKWQLDLLVNGQSVTFLGLGEASVPSPSELLALDTTRFPDGNHLLRLRVVRRDGNYDEYFVPFNIRNYS